MISAKPQQIQIQQQSASNSKSSFSASSSSSMSSSSSSCSESEPNLLITEICAKQQNTTKCSPSNNNDTDCDALIKEEIETDDTVISDDILSSNVNNSNLNNTCKLLPNSSTASSAESLLINQVHEYWKNFDIKRLQYDLDNQIKDMRLSQNEYEDIYTKYNDTTREIKKSLNEDVFKTVSSILKPMQLEIDNLSERCKSNESTCVDLFKLLTAVPDPFPVIEIFKELSDTDLSQQIQLLQKENKDLKATLNAYTNEINLMNKQESKQTEQDKELIQHLSDQVAKTTSLNLDLTTKLKISEGEIESYKKILIDYQNQLSEMKVKHINELNKSEYSSLTNNQKQENDNINNNKLRKTDLSQTQSQNHLSNSSDNNNSINNKTTKTVKQEFNNTSESNETNMKLPKLSTSKVNLTSNVNGVSSLPSSCSPSPSSSSSLSSTSFNNCNNTTNSLKTLLDSKVATIEKEKQQQLALAASAFISSFTSNSNSNFKPLSNLKSSYLRNQMVINIDANNNIIEQPVSPTTIDYNNNNTIKNEDTLSEDSNTVLTKRQRQSLSPANCSSPLNTSNTLNYEPLNTADIAQKVRDLLSLHNIGQRIFAKFILGLSQGTVSELLSKPKHWDKLTEKGRESYRKMYTWSCSDQSINTLKAISPRKGNKDNFFYQNGGKEDSATEEKIAQILFEAQKQMQAKRGSNTTTSNNNMLMMDGYSASSPSARSGSNTPRSRSPSSHHQNHNHHNDDQDQDQDQNSDTETENDQYNNKLEIEAASLYPLDLTVKTSKSLLTTTLTSTPFSPRSYLAAIATNSNNLNFQAKKRKLESSTGQTFSSNYNSEDEEEDSNNLIGVNQDLSSMSSQAAVVAANFKQLMKDYSKFSTNNTISATHKQFSTNSTPLKQIISIADSFLLTNQFNQLKSENIKSTDLLISSPGNNSSFSRPNSTTSPSLLQQQSGHSSTKPLKCVLPPVSQEQFDKYSLINTDDLVRKVKDLLSKFSISQRLFGECILGLSQGSVSDLLARPKPWIMLTQKGREPFIRMQMFIDDPDAIKKLMANQYKNPNNTNTNANPSTKLENSTTVIPLAAVIKTEKKSLSQNNLLIQDANKILMKQEFSNNNYQSHLLLLQQSVAAAAAASTTPSSSDRNYSSYSTQSNDNSNDSELKSSCNGSTFTTQINTIPYDISSLSSIGDLNTEEITNRVKETLLNNNIGQKLFGEAVLNLSQGTVSELLSKPKPWNTLSIKGREPYLRMFMWLNDGGKLEKLNDWKEEKNFSKRHSADMSGGIGGGGTGMGGGGMGDLDNQKPKRRFIFSEEQKDQLMNAFKYDPYPAVNQMEILAGKLGLQTRTVINWFHNHRMRIRYKNTSQAMGHAQNPSQNGNFQSQNFLMSPSPPSMSNNNFKRNKNLHGSIGANRDLLAASFFNFQNGGGLGEVAGRGGRIMMDNEDNDDENDDEAVDDYDEDDNSYNERLMMNQDYEKDQQQQQDQEEDEDEGGDEEDEDMYNTQNNTNNSDHEAEINSLYIPQNNQSDDNDNRTKDNNETGEQEDQETEETDDNDDYNYQNGSTTMNGCQFGLNENLNAKSNKRRKPHNPQKLTSNNLDGNNKLVVQSSNEQANE